MTTTPKALILSVLLATIFAGLVLNLSELDLWLSSRLANGVHGFPLQHSWLAERLLHYYAGKMTLVLALLVILFNLKQLLRPSPNLKLIVAGRYVLLSWLLSYLTIGVVKHTSTLPCPWNLSQFGGQSEYVSILDLYSSQYPIGHCFPAGHATGAYGLLCLGFVLLAFNKPMRLAVVPVLLLGSLYSGAQFVRGAHFISHDLFSIAICLAFAWLLAELYLLPQARLSSTGGNGSQSAGGFLLAEGSLPAEGSSSADGSLSAEGSSSAEGSELADARSWSLRSSQVDSL